MRNRGTTEKFALDIITAFSDDELYHNLSNLRREMDTHNKRRGNNKKIHELEVEVCYLQREIYIREGRKTRHHAYVQSRMQSRPSRYSRR